MKNNLLKLAALCACFLLGGCRNDCILPPPLVSESDKKQAIDLAAKLANVPVDANIKTAFEQHMKSSYQTLSDKNVTLYLCLRAIDCYARHKNLSPEIQKELIQTVRAYMMGMQGVAGGVGPMSPLERRIIEQGQNSKEILELFDQLGVATHP